MAGGGIDFHTEFWLARHWMRLRRRAGAFTEGQRMMIREMEEQLLGRALALVVFLAAGSLLAWIV